MEHLIPIGQFAAMTRLSAKALRLYDENGLPPPARVDPATGYRYYRPEQVAAGRLIRLLRAADVPLAEIRALLAEPGTNRRGWRSPGRSGKLGSGEALTPA